MKYTGLRGLLFIGVVVLAGCGGAQGVRTGGPAGEPTPAISATDDAAQLFVLNVSQQPLISHSADFFDISDNGAPVLSLSERTYKSVQIAPGMHDFRCSGYPLGQVVSLNAVKGGTYYLVVAHSPWRSLVFPLAGDWKRIELVSEAEAQGLMRALSPE